MADELPVRSPTAVGPTGSVLRLDDLPAPQVRRWVARRKAEVVAAVDAGLLSADEACGRYGLSIEELAGWRAAMERYGLGGLRVTRLQFYAERRPRRAAPVPPPGGPPLTKP